MEHKVKKSLIPTDFLCNICNKFYGSASSLCNHNKKFHTSNGGTPGVLEGTLKKTYNCDYCNKIFNDKSNKYKHHKICKFKNNIINNTTNNTNIISSLSCEYCNKVFATRQSKSKHKIKTCKFKNNIINNTTKIHSKTLQINNTSNNDIVINNKIIKSNDNNFFVDLNKNFMTFNDKPIKFFYYNDQIFFKGIDIALMLDYIDTDQAIRKNVDDEDIIIIGELLKDPVSQTGFFKNELLKKDNLKTIYINESGFYTIILKSKKDEAKKFRRWVTSEVLPSIRKYGSYSIINNYIEEDLDKYYGIDCVYVIHIKDDIYKYGNTSHLFKRLQTHKTNFDYIKIIKIYEMKNINDAIKLEKKIIKLTKSLNINIIYNLGNTNHKEMFKVNNNDLDNVIKKIDDFSLDVNNKILDNNNQLKIEEEKTKQLELEYKTIQLKLELYKLSSIIP
jgi:prophage antirepressor-like protein